MNSQISQQKPRNLVPIESVYEAQDPDRCFTCDTPIGGPIFADEGCLSVGPVVSIIRVCRDCSTRLSSVPVDPETYAKASELLCKRHPDLIAKAITGRY